MSKLETRYIKVSKKLYDEIKYAQSNLNKIEQNKIKQKKKVWSMIEASDELGIWLNSNRKK